MEPKIQNRLGDSIRKEKSKPKEASGGPWMAMLLAALLVWAGWEIGFFNRLIDRPIVITESSSQVLFVICDDMTAGQGQASSSLLVENFCIDNGIERRVLMKGQDPSGSDPWLQEMTEIGYPQAPCLVFRSDTGQMEWIEIPSSVQKTIEEIEDRI